jgi:hypothetical protein
MNHDEGVTTPPLPRLAVDILARLEAAGTSPQCLARLEDGERRLQMARQEAAIVRQRHQRMRLRASPAPDAQQHPLLRRREALRAAGKHHHGKTASVRAAASCPVAASGKSEEPLMPTDLQPATRQLASWPSSLMMPEPPKLPPTLLLDDQQLVPSDDETPTPVVDRALLKTQQLLEDLSSLEIGDSGATWAAESVSLAKLDDNDDENMSPLVTPKMEDILALSQQDQRCAAVLLGRLSPCEAAVSQKCMRRASSPTSGCSRAEADSLCDQHDHDGNGARSHRSSTAEPSSPWPSSSVSGTAPVSPRLSQSRSQMLLSTQRVVAPRLRLLRSPRTTTDVRLQTLHPARPCPTASKAAFGNMRLSWKTMVVTRVYHYLGWTFDGRIVDDV